MNQYSMNNSFHTVSKCSGVRLRYKAYYILRHYTYGVTLSQDYIPFVDPNRYESDLSNKVLYDFQ